MDTAAAAAVAAGALAYYEGQPRQKCGARGAVTAEAFTGHQAGNLTMQEHKELEQEDRYQRRAAFSDVNAVLNSCRISASVDQLLQVPVVTVVSDV